MAGQKDKCITGQVLHLSARTGQEMEPTGSDTRFRLPQIPLLGPWRLTATEGGCKIAQHHPESEKQVTSSVEAHKLPRATIRPQSVGTGCSASSLHPLASEQVAGAPHSKEDLKSQ